MDQQVIKEMIELIGGKRIEFNPSLVIRETPHSWPIKVKAVSYDRFVEVEYELMYEPKDGKTLWENTEARVQNAIVQRLRLVIYQRTKKENVLK